MDTDDLGKLPSCPARGSTVDARRRRRRAWSRSKRTDSVRHAWPRNLTSLCLRTAPSCRSSSTRGTVQAARLLPTVTSSHSSRKPKRPCQSSCSSNGSKATQHARKILGTQSRSPSNRRSGRGSCSTHTSFRPNQSAPSNSRTDESELLHLRPLQPSGLNKVDRRFTCGRSIGGVREHRSITRSFCRVRPAKSGPIAVHDNLGGPVDGQKCDPEKGT